MRFLADENFPGAAVRALVAAGHDIVWVREVQPIAERSDWVGHFSVVEPGRVRMRPLAAS